jgi:nucleoside-diphosphate-sugar epimerase
MRVFVAGSGGFIGIPLCHQLAKEGHEVIAFDRYFFGRKPEGDKITVVTGDIRLVNVDDLRGCDAVVDLAGLSNDASCEIDPKHTREINVEGAQRLFWKALNAGVKRYVYSSSASVYGHGESQNLTEESPVHPLTEYARSKLEVEKYLRERKFDFVILRNATVFGVAPRMRFDLAVNAMTARAMTEGVIYVMGGGNQWRPLIHVEDVVKTIMWALYNAHESGISGETFNVGCQANQMRIRSLAGRIANTFPNVRIHMIPDNADERSYHLSFDKLKKARPQARYITIENGVWEIRNALTRGEISYTDPTTMTVNWYKSMLEWNQRLEELKRGGPIL